MKKFEIGKEYFDRSACNHDCIFTIKIIKRTEKTVTFERNGKTRRAKLFFDERGEYIIPVCRLTLYRGGGFRRSVFRAAVSTATAQKFSAFSHFPY